MTAAACMDGLACITTAVAMYRAALTDVKDCPAVETSVDVETEIRTRIPYVFGQFSPRARAQMLDHLDHVEELVAFVYRLENRTATVT